VLFLIDAEQGKLTTERFRWSSGKQDEPGRRRGVLGLRELSEVQIDAEDWEEQGLKRFTRMHQGSSLT
jgi:hypothetical protein